MGGDLRAVLLAEALPHCFLQGDGVEQQGVMETLQEHVDLERRDRLD